MHYEIAVRPPYAWKALLAFLSDRLIAGVEHVDEGRYLRSLVIESSGERHRGWVEVSLSPHTPTLHVAIAPSLSCVSSLVLERMSRLFDVTCNPQAISPVVQALHPVAGLRVPGTVDGFEIGVRAIVGQQVSVKAAKTLAGRIAARFGEPVVTPSAMVTRTFPRAQSLAALSCGDLTALGITTKRADSIIALAQAVASNTLALSPPTHVAQTIEQLKNLPGIGEWTAQYIAMRALSWPDAFPYTDLGVIKALGERNPRKILATAERWRPWRAYATMRLWASLSLHTHNHHIC